MPSRASYFKITNHTSKTATLSVSSVDNYDWDGSSRPDHNLHNRTLPAKQSIQEREELNYFATSHMFTLAITFDDGKKLALRIDQGVAIGNKHGDARNMSAGVGRDLSGAIVSMVALIRHVTQHGERGTVSVTGDTSHYHTHFDSRDSTLHVDIYEA